MINSGFPQALKNSLCWERIIYGLNTFWNWIDFLERMNYSFQHRTQIQLFYLSPRINAPGGKEIRFKNGMRTKFCFCIFQFLVLEMHQPWNYFKQNEKHLKLWNSLCRCVTMMSWSAWWRSPLSCRRSSGSLTWTRPGRCSPPTESPKRLHPNWRLARPLRRNDAPLFHHHVLSRSVILGFQAPRTTTPEIFM